MSYSVAALIAISILLLLAFLWAIRRRPTPIESLLGIAALLALATAGGSWAPAVALIFVVFAVLILIFWEDSGSEA